MGVENFQFKLKVLLTKEEKVRPHIAIPLMQIEALLTHMPNIHFAIDKQKGFEF